MSQSHPKYLYILLLAGAPFVCCSPRHGTEKPAYSDIPTGSLIHSFKGEQWDVVFQYGMPDRAFQGPLGVTRWIYCDCNKPGRVMTIEFGSQGGILLHQLGEDTSLCPVKRPRLPSIRTVQ